jgi:uncharacterized protein (DUF2336 family)
MMVSDLLNWMQQAPPGRRAEAAPSLARSFLHADLPAGDRKAVEAAMTLLLDDPEVPVRRALAEALAHHAEAPRHLLLALSRDVPDVAGPVLQHSPVLIDYELVDAVATSVPRLQVAVALRPYVSRAVSAAIAEVGDRVAVAALLRNDGSVLADLTFRRIAERFGEDAGIRAALFARADLPVIVRQSLIAALAGRLPVALAGETWISRERAAAMARDACDKATVLLAATVPPTEMPSLVEHLRATGQLTTSLLVRAMCAGNISLFEAALSCLSGVPVARAFAVLSEGSETGLVALFRRAGLPARSHAVFLSALEIWRETLGEMSGDDPHGFARRMIERILTRYQDFDTAEVDDLLAMLRQIAAEAARDSARSYVEATLAAA